METATMPTRVETGALGMPVSAARQAAERQGKEFDATHGSGSGTSANGTNGGAYGGGGGLFWATQFQSGFGGGGIIVITYVPTTSPVPRAHRCGGRPVYDNGRQRGPAPAPDFPVATR